jgi:hypothetical protein
VTIEAVEGFCGRGLDGDVGASGADVVVSVGLGDDAPT